MTHIRLIDPLPCSVFHPENKDLICGKPAYAGYIYKYVESFIPGRWIIQPICESCIKATNELYKDDGNGKLS